jgi:hypothetical protein
MRRVKLARQRRAREGSASPGPPAATAGTRPLASSLREREPAGFPDLPGLELGNDLMLPQELT